MVYINRLIKIIAGFCSLILIGEVFCDEKPVNTDVRPVKCGGVCFTFDDRYFNNWIKILPLFEKYNVRATFFIYGRLTDKHIEKIRKIQKYGHAIGAHSIKHLDAVNYCREYSIGKYLQNEISPQLEIFSKAGIKVSSFAYPYSRRNKTIDEALIKIFRHLRTGGFINSQEKLSDHDEFFVSVKNIKKQKYLIGYGIDSVNKYNRIMEQIIDAMKRASKNNEIIVFYGHNISDKHIRPEVLEKIFQAGKKLKLMFYSFDELP